MTTPRSRPAPTAAPRSHPSYSSGIDKSYQVAKERKAKQQKAKQQAADDGGSSSGGSGSGSTGAVPTTGGGSTGGGTDLPGTGGDSDSDGGGVVKDLGEVVDKAVGGLTNNGGNPTPNHPAPNNPGPTQGPAGGLVDKVCKNALGVVIPCP